MLNCNFVKMKKYARSLINNSIFFSFCTWCHRCWYYPYIKSKPDSKRFLESFKKELEKEGIDEELTDLKLRAFTGGLCEILYTSIFIHEKHLTEKETLEICELFWGECN